MAAPSPSARVDPLGARLLDGYRCLTALSSQVNASMWEIGVTPPGLDGGDAIDTTTMHNDVYRTVSSRALKTMTAGTVRGAYDPRIYTTFVSLINDEDNTVTTHFPNGDSLAYYGFLQNFEPDELVEGEMPEASFTITPTNYDVNAGTEESPVLTQAAGT